MANERYVTPLDARVAREVAKLDLAERESFEERAAIMEYEGGMPRREAEQRALAEVLTERQLRAQRADGHGLG
ncbi:hypothetical protein [Ideonella dechloratans]|uniref:hypothetical protein n=1 Tax=Ideonella dechloratans TaxID=36863 RepID=UPI0035AFDEDB